MNIRFEASNLHMKVEDTKFNDVFRLVRDNEIYVRTYDGAVPIIKTPDGWLLGEKVFFSHIHENRTFRRGENVTVLGKLSIEMD